MLPLRTVIICLAVTAAPSYCSIRIGECMFDCTEEASIYNIARSKNIIAAHGPLVGPPGATPGSKRKAEKACQCPDFYKDKIIIVSSCDDIMKRNTRVLVLVFQKEFFATWMTLEAGL